MITCICRCMCALCTKQTSRLRVVETANGIGRSYVQTWKMHPRARMEGQPRPFLPRAAKHLTLPPPPPPPPLAFIRGRAAACRGPCTRFTLRQAHLTVNPALARRSGGEREGEADSICKVKRSLNMANLVTFVHVC